MLEFETDFSVEMKGFSAKVISWLYLLKWSYVKICQLSLSNLKLPLPLFGKKSRAVDKSQDIWKFCHISFQNINLGNLGNIYIAWIALDIS